MMQKTRAIVLYQVDYSDTCMIAHLLTENFGRITYLTAKNKAKKSRTPRVLFHPLSVVELEVEHRPLRELQRLREARPHLFLPSIRSHPVKGALCIFLAEFLGKILPDRQADAPLFEYVLQSIGCLEVMERDYANFHLVFMIGLSRRLGFYPDDSTYRPGRCFDMQNGVFAPTSPGPQRLNISESHTFHQLQRMNYENMAIFRFSRLERNEILGRILEYYRIHLHRTLEIRSLAVLNDLFA
jgi:DNA repair protein RecO (recombination protein O)